MMGQSHYFKPGPNLKHHAQTIHYQLAKQSFVFETGSGVFSKDKVDYGTEVMLKAVLKDFDTLSDVKESQALDFGCGYGVVSIILNTLFPDQKWQGLDVNPRAINLARKNAKLAKLNISYLESDGIPQDFPKFDFILLNPPIRTGKTVYYELFKQASRHLAADGFFYIVIQKKQGAKSAFSFLETLFREVKTIDKTSGYHTIRCGNSLANL